MRVVATLAFAMLGLAAVSLVPASSAASIPPPCQSCVPPQCLGYDTVGVITVAVRLTGDTDCDQHVILLSGVGCTGPLGGSTRVTEGHVDVIVPYCGLDPTTCIQEGTCDPPLGAAPAAAPAPTAIPPCQCPPPRPLCEPINQILAPGDGPVTYRLSDYCHLTVIIDLSGGCGLQGTEWTNTTFNPVEVAYHHCQSPPQQAAPAIVPPCQYCVPACKPVQVGTGEVLDKIGPLFGFLYGGPRVEAGVASDCHPYLDESNLRCPTGLPPGHVDEQAGPASVSADTCTLGSICACMPAGPDSSAPVSIPPCECPAPAPLCQPINRLIASGDGPVTWTLDDYCHVHILVTLDLAGGCGLQGTEWTYSTVGPVEVAYHHCQSPPPEAAPAAAPGPDLGCTLRDATPAAGPSVGPITPIALRQAIWGNDCTLDVDPIGACAPPSGSTIDRTVLFVHLHLLVCGGNPPPLE